MRADIVRHAIIARIIGVTFTGLTMARTRMIAEGARHPHEPFVGKNAPFVPIT